MKNHYDPFVCSLRSRHKTALQISIDIKLIQFKSASRRALNSIRNLYVEPQAVKQKFTTNNSQYEAENIALINQQ